ncbi:hypothetical protein HK097_008943 [Rhizophlyctis rosea]|uniref:Uncharacterized protein n=1 Tax=Rhizophlyctis rosea TaxID=64517 RepID=A0AAD5X1D6_9FUNG|nr:hypothetical protein HK097_008943 [Rhizophlyctis rosea]
MKTKLSSLRTTDFTVFHVLGDDFCVFAQSVTGEFAPAAGYVQQRARSDATFQAWAEHIYFYKSDSKGVLKDLATIWKSNPAPKNAERSREGPSTAPRAVVSMAESGEVADEVASPSEWWPTGMERSGKRWELEELVCLIDCFQEFEGGTEEYCIRFASIFQRKVSAVKARLTLELRRDLLKPIFAQTYNASYTRYRERAHAHAQAQAEAQAQTALSQAVDSGDEDDREEPRDAGAGEADPEMGSAGAGNTSGNEEHVEGWRSVGSWGDSVDGLCDELLGEDPDWAQDLARRLEEVGEGFEWEFVEEDYDEYGGGTGYASAWGI